MKHTCQEMDPLIDDLVIGVVVSKGMMVLQEHLVACAACQTKLVTRYREERALSELGAQGRLEILTRRIKAALNGKVPQPPPANSATVSHRTLPFAGKRTSTIRRWMAAAAALVLLTVGLSWWLTSSSRSVARIESVQGAGHVVTKSVRVPVVAGMDLSAGQLLETGPDSSVVIVLADQTRIELAAQTVLDKLVPETKTSGKEVVLSRGQLCADVRPQPAGRPMLCRTPHGTATVLGTRLRLSVVTDATQLEVSQGSVQLANGEKSTAVGAGYYAIAGKGFELTPQRFTPALANLPSGSVVRFNEDFASDSAASKWNGLRQLKAGGAGDWAVLAGPLTSPEFRKTLFAELRSPWQQAGWRVGANTYLRFHYLAEAFSPKQGIWLTLKRKDGNNYGATIKKTVPDRWQNVTVRLADLPLVVKPSQRIAEGETLHEIALFASIGGANLPPAARFWIDHLILFESPQPLPPGEVADVLVD